MSKASAVELGTTLFKTFKVPSLFLKTGSPVTQVGLELSM